MSARCQRCNSTETVLRNTIGCRVDCGSFQLTTEGPVIVEMRHCASCGYHSVSVRQAHTLEHSPVIHSETKEAVNG